MLYFFILYLHYANICLWHQLQDAYNERSKKYADYFLYRIGPRLNKSSFAAVLLSNNHLERELVIDIKTLH